MGKSSAGVLDLYIEHLLKNMTQPLGRSGDQGSHGSSKKNGMMTPRLANRIFRDVHKQCNSHYQYRTPIEKNREVTHSHQGIWNYELGARPSKASKGKWLWEGWTRGKFSLQPSNFQTQALQGCRLWTHSRVIGKLPESDSQELFSRSTQMQQPKPARNMVLMNKIEFFHILPHPI